MNHNIQQNKKEYEEEEEIEIHNKKHISIKKLKQIKQQINQRQKNVIHSQKKCWCNYAGWWMTRLRK